MVKNVQPDELSPASSRSTPASRSSATKRSTDQSQLETPLPRLAAQQRLHMLNDASNIRPSYHYQEPETLAASSGDLSIQMHEICQCLSTFIDEQKSFNHHIEQRLTTATKPFAPDPIFNQLQQQVLAQGLIVNLNSAYREIAVLQSEVNALQSENNRLLENPGLLKKPLVERTSPKLERQGEIGVYLAQTTRLSFRRNVFD